MKKPIFSLITSLCFLFCPTSPASAQQSLNCGNDILEANLQSHSGYRIQEERTRADYQEFLSQSRSATSTYVIPTVIHIVQRSDDTLISAARVQSQIDVLNEDFRLLNEDTTLIPPVFQSVAADADIEFRLATIDPYGCPTNGINRITSPLALLDWNYGRELKETTQWNPHNYMNIWVVESINGGFIAGYAINPTYLAIDSVLDGIVIGAIFFGRGWTSPITPNNRGRTLTHEVGHYFGLHHTFYNGCLGTSPSDCMTMGDEVCDTPPTASPNSNCANLPNSCTESPVDLPDQVHNHMDYSGDLCRVMFTQGQADRMHFFLNDIRANLYSPANLAATGLDGSVSPGCAPRPQFTSQSQHFCVGDTAFFQDLSAGMPTSWNWTFQGGSPANSTQQNPAVVFQNPGAYTVTLETANSFGSATTTDTAFIHVAASSAPPLFESFEGNSLPVDWHVVNEDGLKTWEGSSNGSSLGTRCMRKRNYGDYYNSSSDHLVSKPIDLSGYVAGFLTYDIAYRRYNSFNQDSLFVELSTDCGRTWTTEWLGAGLTLATVAGVQVNAAFVPAPANWRKDSIDLAPYMGASNLRIRFRVVGVGGQDLFLDNVNIDGVVSSGAPAPSWQLSVVSPIKEEIELHCHLKRPLNLQFTLLDMRGKAVWRESVAAAAGSQWIQLGAGEVGSLPKGVYVLLVDSEAGRLSRKLIK